MIDGGILDEIISEKLEAFNARYEELSHLVRICMVGRKLNLSMYNLNGTLKWFKAVDRNH